MAVALDAADNIDYSTGASSALSGATGLTIALGIRSTSHSNGNRLVSLWGSVAAFSVFLLSMEGTGDIAFTVTAGSNYFQRVTSGLNFLDGISYRLVFKWLAGSPDTMEAWANGTALTMVDGFQTTNQAGLNLGTTNLQLGFETAEAQSGVPGDYSEFGLWYGALADEVCYSMSLGFSPSYYGHTNPLIYTALRTTADLNNRFRPDLTNAASIGWANSGFHPATIYPVTPITAFTMPGDGGGSPIITYERSLSLAGSVALTASGADTTPVKARIIDVFPTYDATKLEVKRI